MRAHGLQDDRRAARSAGIRDPGVSVCMCVCVCVYVRSGRLCNARMRIRRPQPPLLYVVLCTVWCTTHTRCTTPPAHPRRTLHADTCWQFPYNSFRVMNARGGGKKERDRDRDREYPCRPPTVLRRDVFIISGCGFVWVGVSDISDNITLMCNLRPWPRAALYSCPRGAQCGPPNYDQKCWEPSEWLPSS